MPSSLFSAVVTAAALIWPNAPILISPQSTQLDSRQRAAADLATLKAQDRFFHQTYGTSRQFQDPPAPQWQPAAGHGSDEDWDQSGQKFTTGWAAVYDAQNAQYLGVSNKTGNPEWLLDLHGAPHIVTLDKLSAALAGYVWTGAQLLSDTEGPGLVINVVSNLKKFADVSVAAANGDRVSTVTGLVNMIDDKTGNVDDAAKKVINGAVKGIPELAKGNLHDGAREMVRGAAGGIISKTLDVTKEELEIGKLPGAGLDMVADKAFDAAFPESEPQSPKASAVTGTSDEGSLPDPGVSQKLVGTLFHNTVVSSGGPAAGGGSDPGSVSAQDPGSSPQGNQQPAGYQQQASPGQGGNGDNSQPSSSTITSQGGGDNGSATATGGGDNGTGGATNAGGPAGSGTDNSAAGGNNNAGDTGATGNGNGAGTGNANADSGDTQVASAGSSDDGTGTGSNSGGSQPNADGSYNMGGVAPQSDANGDTLWGNGSGAGTDANDGRLYIRNAGSGAGNSMDAGSHVGDLLSGLPVIPPSNVLQTGNGAAGGPMKMNPTMPATPTAPTAPSAGQYAPGWNKVGGGWFYLENINGQWKSVSPPPGSHPPTSNSGGNAGTNSGGATSPTPINKGNNGSASTITGTSGGNSSTTVTQNGGGGNPGSGGNHGGSGCSNPPSCTTTALAVQGKPLSTSNAKTTSNVKPSFLSGNSVKVASLGNDTIKPAGVSISVPTNNNGSAGLKPNTSVHSLASVNPAVTISTPNVKVTTPTTHISTVHVTTPTVHVATPTVHVATPTVHVPTPSVHVSTITVRVPTVRVPTVRVPTVHINVPTVRVPTISDIRLKQDIAELGTMKNGMHLYRYRYIGNPQLYVGVMAQEVARIRPDAVVQGEDGYLRVYYDRLGIRLMTDTEWRRARPN